MQREPNRPWPCRMGPASVAGAAGAAVIAGSLCECASLSAALRAKNAAVICSETGETHQRAFRLVAVGQARKKTEGGSAGRLAAARRPGRGDDGSSSKTRDKEKRPAGKRGKKQSANPIARFAKLVMLLALMAALGFAVVLIVDVAQNLVGGVRFGDITFKDLVDKVQNRVLDRDVPEPKKRAPLKAKTERPRPTTRAPTATEAATPTERAPLQAPSPDDYVRHVEPRVDPEVEKARARLDALLN